MSKSKVKKVKIKTHKASVKRFKVSNPKGNKQPKVLHRGQRDGNGHSNNYMNRRQRQAPKSARSLSSAKEARKILRLINA